MRIYGKNNFLFLKNKGKYPEFGIVDDAMFVFVVLNSLSSRANLSKSEKASILFILIKVSFSSLPPPPPLLVIVRVDVWVVVVFGVEMGHRFVVVVVVVVVITFEFDEDDFVEDDDDEDEDDDEERCNEEEGCCC